MNLFERIKRFWIRKVLRRVYDPDEIFEMPITYMNQAETIFFIESLYIELIEMRVDFTVITSYVSEALSPCDKCFDLEVSEAFCFKCEGTELVKNKQLCSWPWEDQTREFEVALKPIQTGEKLWQTKSVDVE